MELPVLNLQGQATGNLTVSDRLFARPFNEPLVHQVVVACQSNLRQGTRKQKGRSEIAKSTRKPWKQKGTGNARAGMASSPLWRGGGKIFPSATNENFHHKINRKMYSGAMAVILSQLLREERLRVVDELHVSTHKTKGLTTTLSGLDMTSGLVVVNPLDDNLEKAGRNLAQVTFVEPQDLNPLLLIEHPRVLLTREAVVILEKTWASATPAQ